MIDGTQILSVKYPWGNSLNSLMLIVRAKRIGRGDEQGRGGQFAKVQTVPDDYPKEVRKAAGAYQMWNTERVREAKLKRRYIERMNMLTDSGADMVNDPKLEKMDVQLKAASKKVALYKKRLDRAKAEAAEQGYKIDSRGKWKNKPEGWTPDQLSPLERVENKWKKKGFDRVAHILDAKELIEAEEIWSTLGVKSGIDLPDFLNKSFNFTDKKTGIRIEIESVTGMDTGEISSRTAEIMDTPTIEVSGKIFNKDGKRVGRFLRQFDKDGVEHSYLSMLSTTDGGFGARFYSYTEKQYVEAGIQGDIRIHANLDVGGYAWARMGYNFKSKEERSLFQERFIENYDTKYGEGASKSIKIPETPYEMASFVGPSKVSATTMGMGTKDVEYGKWFMLGQEWQAAKPINPDSIEWKVGEAYYKAKGVL